VAIDREAIHGMFKQIEALDRELHTLKPSRERELAISRLSECAIWLGRVHEPQSDFVYTQIDTMMD
jgi:hypothetical protein